MGLLSPVMLVTWIYGYQRVQDKYSIGMSGESYYASDLDIWILEGSGQVQYMKEWGVLLNQYLGYMDTKGFRTGIVQWGLLSPLNTSDLDIWKLEGSGQVQYRNEWGVLLFSILDIWILKDSGQVEYQIVFYFRAEKFAMYIIKQFLIIFSIKLIFLYLGNNLILVFKQQSDSCIQATI